VIEVHDFLTDRTETIRIGDAVEDASSTDEWPIEQHAAAGHGGGDARLMARFVAAIATGDRTKILSGPAESLESHLMVFAAEQARRNGVVVDAQREECAG
jgi:hypothetical protein